MFVVARCDVSVSAIQTIWCAKHKTHSSEAIKLSRYNHRTTPQLAACTLRNQVARTIWGKKGNGS